MLSINMGRGEGLYSVFGNDDVLLAVVRLVRLLLRQAVFYLLDELLVLVITLDEGCVPSYCYLHVLIRC